VSSITAGEALSDQLVDSIFEAKLRPPAPRSEWVMRVRLLEELERAARRAVTLIAAPAGYGKTTVVAQWLASESAPANVAWISLDTSDNDPARLWTQIATALERAGCTVARDTTGFVAAGGYDMPAVVLPRIVDAIAAFGENITVLIDDFHMVRAVECNEQIDFFIKHYRRMHIWY
jgi:LuxR family maltose regulon positive regulatory protein